MNFKEDLTCKYCNDIYKQPITFACGDSVCKHHIEELSLNNSANKFMCPICNEENSTSNFKVNKFMQKMVENEFHKFQIDSKYKDTLEGFKNEIKKLETVLKDPENLIYEEISELKRQVDLDREMVKSKIDDLADGMIKKLEYYEGKLKAECKSLDLRHYNEFMNLSKSKLVDYEKCLSLFSSTKEERDEKRSQSEIVINMLKLKINEAKRDFFFNITLKYKATEANVEDWFGKLKIKVYMLFLYIS